MKLLLFTFYALICSIGIKAQTLQSTTDSSHHYCYVKSYTELLPLEHKVPSQENKYHSTSSSFNVGGGALIFVLKLRSNCTFIYEAYHKTSDSLRVAFCIGTYTLDDNLIRLMYRPIAFVHPDTIYISPTTSVSWLLPKRPEYLLVKKSKLMETNEKGRSKKNKYLLNDTMQFTFGACK